MKFSSTQHSTCCCRNVAAANMVEETAAEIVAEVTAEKTISQELMLQGAKKCKTGRKK
jgi:hypothetical protein